MDHLYDKIYYTDYEDTQDIYSQDLGVPVTELNTEADATFIDIVRSYPHLAKNLKDFKDRNIRERSWEEIASVVNCSGMWNYIDSQLIYIYRIQYVQLFTVEDCQRRWLRLREKFTRERKLRDQETRSGSGSITGRNKFPLYPNMMFLSEHIQTRK